jgi:hypothetical protein
MKGIGYFYKPIKKRPELLLIFGIVTFLYCYIEYKFIMPVVFGLSILKTGNIFGSIMHLIQMVLNNLPNINPVYFVFLFIAIITVSLVASLILSGYLNVLNSSFIDSHRVKGTFAKGIQKHYLKITRTTFLTILYSLLFMIFMVVVAVPSIVITSAAITEKPELLTVSGILNFITLAIMFFSIMFFRIYILFWYPAAINFDKKLFAKGKRAADASFWRVVASLLWFDFLFIVIQSALFIANSYLSKSESAYSGVISVVVLLFVNWIFKTVLFASIINVAFEKFISYWKKQTDDVNER